MLRTRVMPCLLLRNGSLVKTVQFKNPKYIGDPLNTVRIYNEQEVDELIFLDITASQENKEPPYKLIEEIAQECFMPFTYGGGINTLEQAKRLFSSGVEKIALNTITYQNPELITKIAELFGNQSIVISIDVKRAGFRKKYYAYSHGGRKREKISVIDHAKKVVAMGAGEILITSMEHEGMMEGYDLELIHQISQAVNVPIIACGGAGNLLDFNKAVAAGASAVAAGSMVVYQGKHRAVLTNFPSQQALKGVLN